MDGAARAGRQRVPGTVRFVERFVAEAEIPAFMRRADLVVLPYRDIEQSGVLYTALAFGSALVLSDVGGFPEIAERRRRAARAARRPGGAGRRAGRAARRPCRPRAARRRRRAAAAGPYSWDRDRRADRGPVRRAARAIIPGDGRSRSSSGSPLGLIVYAHLGYPLLLWALSRASAGAERAGRPRRRASCPRSRLIIAAYDEEEVIEREARQRAGARLSARSPPAHRRLGRLHATARPSAPARPAPTSCSSSRAAARSRR